MEIFLRLYGRDITWRDVDAICRWKALVYNVDVLQAWQDCWKT